MDNIEKLLKNIKGDREIKELWPRRGFSKKLLESVGDVFEIHGFGTAMVFLNDKKAKRETEKEAMALLRLLDKFRQCPEIINSRAIGRYIFKTLNTILTEGE